jgi:hypothetical protein
LPNSPPRLTYPEGLDALIPVWQKRRGRLGFGEDEALPPLNADLAAMAMQRVPSGIAPLPLPASGHAVKRHALMVELAGQSDLALLNGLLIAHLRKRPQPGHTAALFQRVWAEQGVVLRAELSTRWLISSVITFADHGVSEPQRRLGQSLNILFSLMKLYEFERLFSGTPPDQPFRGSRRIRPPLPLDMPDFSLASGGLDINLLAPIWAEALHEPVAGPLACHLLERLNADPGTLFRRLALMRNAQKTRRHKPEMPQGQ